MGKGVNKVILIGNLGGGPEVRYLPNGNAVALLSIATSEYWKDKVSGERQERTEWHRIVLFNSLGEIAGNYLKKGTKVYIEGSLRTRKWQDNQGQDKYMTEIIASDLQMLDSKNNPPLSPSNQNYAHHELVKVEPEETLDRSFKQNSMITPDGLDDDVPF